MHTIEKVWQQHGLTCVALLFNDAGHRCGYVGVDRTHPMYGCSYHEQCAVLEPFLDVIMSCEIGNRGILPIFCWDGSARPDVVFSVHGSLTFSGGDDYPLREYYLDEFELLCHQDIWWFGFDCGHYGDAHDLDAIRESGRDAVADIYSIGNDGIVRTKEYVIQECNRLAWQLSQVESVTTALDHKREIEEEVR